MHLQNIRLINFKNYESLDLVFSPYANCILGENGSGKTNLLDAIHYLSLGKSAFSGSDNFNIRHGESYFALRGEFVKSEQQLQIQCMLERGKRKVLKQDGQPYERLSAHVGRFPSVMMTPYDTDLVREGSETRRSFFDNLISQTDTDYLQYLIQYRSIMRQRNHLLKNEGRIDYTLLDIYDAQIVPLAKSIAKIRADFTQDFKEVFQKHHNFLATDKEQVALKYRTHVEEDFETLLHDNRPQDIKLERSEKGIHKDDFKFLIASRSLKQFGSQGQQKTFVIALQLAKYDFIKMRTGLQPLLLLDDIFDKLDDYRMQRLTERISGGEFGQIFISDARPERTEQLFKNSEKVASQNNHFFYIHKGQLLEKSI
ncbi:MAG: DNA replication/repair protein RecF [Bernardetiaceae bacterium]|nr:DNA replication/repair protein RecF [Bernardetiaceae bacterium]